MPQFKKKPVVVEAVCFLGIEMGAPQFGNSTDSTPRFSPKDEACPEWLQVAFARGGTSTGGCFVRGLGGNSWGGSQELILMIKTLEGEQLANPGDWIIQGIAGEIYPCKPEIFAETYSPVTEKTK